MSRRVALYVRVSTADQTTENQERELTAIAARMGWEVVSIYKDEGVSGSKGRDKRPALNAMLKDVTRRKFDMVMAWSVDRLGRSLQDLVGFLSDLHAARVDLFLHLQGLDTTTPSGRAMFQMLGVFAEFERATRPTVHVVDQSKRWGSCDARRGRTSCWLGCSLPPTCSISSATS
jgi:DNA invertase Pin-like site-specific DNA recombinase